MIIAAAVAILLAAAGLAVFHWEDPPPPAVEPVAEASELAVEGEPQHSARVPQPVPVLPAFESTTNEPACTNLYERFAGGGIPKLRCEDLEPFLARNRRSVEALLGALRASGDDALLKEAKEAYPNDPRVQFAAAFQTESPEERRQWLEKFKESAPDNALANYLLAAEHFKSGHAAEALEELAAATAKPRFENYLLDFVQNTEEAYHASGCSDAEAKAIAMSGALLPELGPLKHLSIAMVDLAKRYEQAGDSTSASELQAMALGLGQRLEGSPQFTLIHELVGVAIERIVLSSMNPEAPCGGTGWTVQNQMDALAAGKKQRQAIFAEAEPALKTLSDQDLGHFFDRMKVYGEVAAMRWVVNRRPPQ